MQREGAWTSVWSPISLATIAAVLEKGGFETKLVDAITENVGFTGLGKIIKDFKPNLIVFNTASGSIESDLSMATFAKKLNPQIKTSTFGIHVSALPDDCFRIEPKLDFIIRGEPEETTLNLAKSLKNNGGLAVVKGISWKNGQKIIHNPPQNPIKNLNDLPFPAWEKIDVANYRMPLSDKPFLLVGTGRGCPYSCVFCADKVYYSRGLRLPSPFRVVDEIEYDQKRFKVNDFLFWTESFTLNRDFAIGVCEEIIKRGLKVRFVVNSRVDHVDQQLLVKLREAGCWQIGFGVESGVNKVLKTMKKCIKVDQIRNAVLASKQEGLLVTGHFMIGFPGESRETILTTIKLACDLPFDFAQFYCAVPFPGSELYQQAIDRGWLESSNWALFEQNFSILTSPNLSAKEIMELRRLAYRKFYLRPRIIFKTLSKIRSPKYLLKALTGFVDWAR